MDHHSILTGRCTVHDYSKEPLPEGALERAFECAIAAPNHRMTEPWRFVRVGPVTREQLCQLSIALKARSAPPRAEVVETTRRKMLSSAELVAVSRERTSDPGVEREDYAAVACAIQNLSLSLWSEGVGSKWSTGGVTQAPQTYQLLGIDPERQEIVGFVWVGIPSAPPTKARRRRGLDEIVRSVP